MTTQRDQIEGRQQPNGMMSKQILEDQNRQFLGTGGRSQENHSLGFVPAFQDTRTGTVYQCCFADGRPAPIHLLDGLPSKLVSQRSTSGRVVSAREGVIAGFIYETCFLTREQAAKVINGSSVAA